MPRTKQPIPDLAIQALEDVIIECQKNGIAVRREPFLENGVHGVVIVLANAAIDADGHLYLVDPQESESGGEP